MPGGLIFGLLLGGAIAAKKGYDKQKIKFYDKQSKTRVQSLENEGKLFAETFFNLDKQREITQEYLYFNVNNIEEIIKEFPHYDLFKMGLTTELMKRWYNTILLAKNGLLDSYFSRVGFTSTVPTDIYRWWFEHDVMLYMDNLVRSKFPSYKLLYLESIYNHPKYSLNEVLNKIMVASDITKPPYYMGEYFWWCLRRFPLDCSMQTVGMSCPV